MRLHSLLLSAAAGGGSFVPAPPIANCTASPIARQWAKAAVSFPACQLEQAAQRAASRDSVTHAS